MSKIFLHISFCFILLLPVFSSLKAQSEAFTPVNSSETSVMRMPSYEKKNPKLALGLSAVLPGAGQVYNGQWYKVPIIYGLGATIGYFLVSNNKEYKYYNKEFKYRTNGDSINFNPELTPYSKENIEYLRDYYQRNVQLMVILSAALYTLNLIDAVVFANLASFDVSDNLSLQISPYAAPRYDIERPMAMDAGIKLTFKLK